MQDYSATAAVRALQRDRVPQDADDRLKADYTDTVNSLLASEHLDPIEDWAADKGLTFRAQTWPPPACTART
ncbi:hypothetical protein [Streptomyces nigrescens]|uniref:hypothetical protein n=1 Tax=Streptomyces nigrescens TaxID=1920 RepID=UPI00225A6FE5|nr:hypothetical protein [Streptomyces libani]MCX5450243.1 hypothetical protein [Streptomyces libani]